MEVSYSEGVANRTDLESCVTFTSRGVTRSVDKGAGRPAIEPRKLVLQDADALQEAEGNMSGDAMRVSIQSCVVREPGMFVSSLHGNRESCGSAGIGAGPCGGDR